MIKIENFEVVGWEHAIRGMRNPLNSWDKSDSDWEFGEFTAGVNDLNLMTKLSKAGHDHRKFMRMIVCYVDVVAPLYWLKEMDQYKVGVTSNSCSTMHKIQAKEFKLDDFSHEYITTGPFDNLVFDGDNNGLDSDDIMTIIVEALNNLRGRYLNTKDKRYWYQMIQLLPSSYNQKRTYCLNYEVLSNIYHARKNHKLDEWHTFCDWIETLPYSELITGKLENVV